MKKRKPKKPTGGTPPPNSDPHIVTISTSPYHVITWRSDNPHDECGTLAKPGAPAGEGGYSTVGHNDKNQRYGCTFKNMTLGCGYSGPDTYAGCKKQPADKCTTNCGTGATCVSTIYQGQTYYSCMMSCMANWKC